MKNADDKISRYPKHLARALFWDRWAKRLITGSGVLVILTVFAIIALIFREVFPLFEGPKSEKAEIFQEVLSEEHILGIGSGDYHETFFTLDSHGHIKFYSRDGKLIATPAPFSARPVLHHEQLGNQIGLTWEDGSATLVKVDFLPQFPDGKDRYIQPKVTVLAEFPAKDGLVKSWLRSHDEVWVRLSQTKDGSLYYERLPSANEQADLFSEVIEPVSIRIHTPNIAAISRALLSKNGQKLVVAFRKGAPLFYQWDEGQKKFSNLEFQGNFPNQITALSFVFGDNGVVIGDSAGQVTGWQRISSPDKDHWLQTKQFSSSLGSVVEISSSNRDKTFVVTDARGHIDIHFFTTQKRLFNFSAQHIIQASISPRNNGLLTLDKSERLGLWSLKSEHPESTTSSLFRKVWYIDYNKPEFVWQSTGGTDSYEPKISIIPLIYGTLKGTFYSMLFALPLSLLGAIYLSQFASKKLRASVKPIIELLAALPSVVIGFLAALWFAPMLEEHLMAFLLFFFGFPLVFLIFIFLWPHLRNLPILIKSINGLEFLYMIPLLLMSGYFFYVIGPEVEKSLFNTTLVSWVYDHWGMRYDSRNSIVIAFALGLTVIPIILSLSEDSLSHVPQSLGASSLALGASQWQTVWRLIVPSALPGIFAAVMIGIGRAIGETMIVLMATGNTPIMDASPLNGFRTLAANIAVEIAEAPVGGTLYRTLFLCAVTLFCLTFALNTTSELVRQSLRKKYGKF